MIAASTEFSSFGTLLKAFRHRQHLTQAHLAQLIGVHRHAIGRWERGDVLPATKGLVLELAKHLRLDDQETRHFLEASLTALAPPWLVPLPRNPFFTGREALLEAVHARLGVEHTWEHLPSIALQGLGGIGKTQIALEYAYRHALEYSAVCWIAAETEEQIVSSLVQTAEALHLPERAAQDQQRLVTEVQRWLATHGQWLLIWDNLEDLGLLDRYLPPTRQGALLLTTRCQTLGTLAEALDLVPMEPEEGLLFLVRRAKLLSPTGTLEDVRQWAVQRPAQYQAAASLVTEMGGLPLALDQAGAYLEATQCGLVAYLDLFRTQRVALLQQRGDGAREHPASVASTFTLALAATTRRYPAVGDLLRVCALLQAEAIPEELFHQGGEHLGAPLAAACRDPLEWDRVVGVACSYSLLARQPQEQTLSLHRLVQAVLVDVMTDEERERWSARVITALDAVFPEVQSTTEYAAWQRCEHFLPHALLCLYREKAAETSLVYASLAYKVAQYLRVRARYAEAEPLYLRALHLREQDLGPDHPDVAFPLTYLAVLYWQQGRYTEAEPLHGRARSIRERTLGPGHPDVACTLNNLALLYGSQGKYAEAALLYRRALRIDEQALGPDHPLVAALLANLANLLRDQGKYAEVEPLHQRALRIWEQALGPDHPLVATSLASLANLFRDQGKYAEAEPLHRRALSIREQGLGPDHPLVATSFANLANLFRDQSKYAEAELLYRRALRIREQNLESEHPDMADTLNGLAVLYTKQGKCEEAEPLYQRALFIRERHLGKLHPETAETLHGLALLHQRQNHLSEALSSAERACAILVQSLGETHPKTVATRMLYDQLLQEPTGAEAEAASRRRPEAMVAPLGNGNDANGASSPLHEAATPPEFENDPLQAFLDACCERHPRAWCRSADLWQAYTCWVEEHQERYPLSRGAFIALLKAHGCRADRTMAARIWRGIAVVKKAL